MAWRPKERSPALAPGPLVRLVSGVVNELLWGGDQKNVHHPWPLALSQTAPGTRVTDVVSESARRRVDGATLAHAGRLFARASLYSCALAAARARALALPGIVLRSRRLIPFRHPWQQPLCSCVLPANDRPALRCAIRSLLHVLHIVMCCCCYCDERLWRSTAIKSIAGN